MKYIVEAQVRNQGAIGIFSIKQYIIDAETAKEARDIVFKRAHKQGYETGFINAQIANINPNRRQS